MGDLGKLYEDVGFLKSRIQSLIELMDRIESDTTIAMDSKFKEIHDELSSINLAITELSKKNIDISDNNFKTFEILSSRIRAVEILFSREQEKKAKRKRFFSTAITWLIRAIGVTILPILIKIAWTEFNLTEKILQLFR